MKQKTQDIVEELSLMSLTMELTILLVVPIIVLTGVGYLIDQSIGGGFFFLITGAVCGMLIASLLAVRKVTAVLRSVSHGAKKPSTTTKNKQ